MGYLTAILPAARRLRIPVTRDQTMLLMAAVNELFLGVDIYLAHSISGTIRAKEWIPIIFGPTAGILLLVIGLLAMRKRMLANLLASIIFILSIGVGLLGAYFHLMRAILPYAPAGQKVTVDLLVWAPPLLGPLTFCLVGILGISAAWLESPTGSGKLTLIKGIHLQMPYSKTQAYFFLVGLGTLATVLSSVLDHARTHFANPWLWIPTVVGVFATIVITTAGVINRPLRGDLWVYSLTLVLMIFVGLLGSYLHIRNNLAAGDVIVGERFIRGAPFLAPLLFANMGALGLVVLLDPAEKQE